MKDLVKYEDFDKLEILVGTILEVRINEKARKPAYILNIDFGQKIGKKQSSAQITNYSIEELLQKQIVAVCNFGKKNIAGIESEVLILGAINDKEEVILVHPEQVVLNGSHIC
tara:strand:- start:22 stop:360 length:339 start_codon:yes stop_codon:yes gene_type:complete